MPKLRLCLMSALDVSKAFEAILDLEREEEEALSSEQRLVDTFGPILDKFFR